MLRNASSKTKAIATLVVYAFLASCMGIFVREMSRYFTTFQQIYLRASVGFILAFFIYGRKIRFQDLLSMPLRDAAIMLIRIFSLYLFGIVLYTKAITNASYANVTFIFALPYSAILGFLILKEKLTFTKIALISCAFFGVLLVSVDNIFSIFNWGYGEILALISAFFYALSSVLRKKISSQIDSKQTALVMLFGGALLIFGISNIAGEDAGQVFTGSLVAYICVFLAGFSNAILSLCIDYGFKHIEALKAGNILYIESIFALFISVFLYTEIPNFREIAGAILITLSAMWINRLKS
jgi:drug/metabolite transporter (DMT)-like permease